MRTSGVCRRCGWPVARPLFVAWACLAVTGTDLSYAQEPAMPLPRPDVLDPRAPVERIEEAPVRRPAPQPAHPPFLEGQRTPPEEHLVGRPAWQQTMQAAEADLRSGQWQDAIGAYQQAFEVAEGPDQKVEAGLALADLLREQGLSTSTDFQQLERAVGIYSEVLDQASGEARLIAHNNYATTLLQLDRPMEAVRLLGAIEPEMAVDARAEVRPLYLYNYGRALEGAGRIDEALSRYTQSLALDASFGPAAEATLHIALTMPEREAGIARATALVQQLVFGGELAQAAESLRAALFHEEWADSVAIADLIAALVQYLTAAAVSPEAFAGIWQDDLAALQERLQGRARDRLDRVFVGYFDDLPVMLEAEWARFFWSEGFGEEADGKPTSSAFLKMIADAYVRADQVEAAFPRYVLAWNLDRENAEAGLRMVNLLLERSEQLDPDGSRLDELIALLFERKGDAYLGEDWPNILRFHTLLGTIFERREQWGPRWNPRSALFQWERALQAQERLLEQGQDPSSTIPVPGLHEKLAQGYRTVGDVAQAWQQYADAAEGFLMVQNVEAASAVLAEVRDLEYVPSSREASRLSFIESQLNEMRALQRER